ncbi:DtxR family transcriptional regulator, Mn-dependent transcriptional regulator [Thermotomaculum hydrothermale]|uniref:Transcriptional regulator MntR n=1 Tax=Thermotomaculum hydrothermale TaxID=981385 RepID=A0A7R6PPQ5_9BACT|nr:metal-dependent transcriptional regulator [Thermotomaculum hydrothermale]BBB33563.1 DtxR family transcriptional regulator, Mn-dependent transcriptional regulator [Thermotomaculum hydrothermale]
MEEKLSKSLEDYLEAILIIKKQKGEVRVKDLMSFFNYKVSSVNQAIKQLKAKELVEHESYGNIKLTEKGKNLAKQVYKKHTLLVEFLSSILQIEQNIAERDACSFEHFIHEETYRKFKKMVKFFNKNTECLKLLQKIIGEEK